MNYNIIINNKWIKFCCYLVLFAILESCKNSIEKKPNNLISKEKMANFLADIHNIEGKVNSLGVQNTDTSAFLYRKLEATIYKKHEIDTAAYFQSYKYYLINADEFTDIYKMAVEKIKAQNKIDSLAEAKAPKLRPDTTKVQTSKQGEQRIFGKKNAFLDSLKLKFKHAKK